MNTKPFINKIVYSFWRVLIIGRLVPFLLFIFPFMMPAQTVFQKVIDYSQWGFYNYGLNVKQTLDSGYVLTGSAGYYVYGATDPVQISDNGNATDGPDEEFLLTKTDSSGNLLWYKTYGIPGRIERSQEVQPTSDNGYFMVGVSLGVDAYYGTDNHGYVVKTNSTGAMQWAKKIGGNYNDYFYSGQPTKDGGYIISGRTNSFGSSIGGVASDLYLVKLDNLGTIQWAKTFGRSGFDEQGSFVRQTTDGGFIVAGQAVSDTGNLLQMALLLKTDAGGNLQWCKKYETTYVEFFSSVKETTDKGFIIMGGNQVLSSLVKTDSVGNLNWSKTYNYNNTGLGYETEVSQTADEGYFYGNAQGGQIVKTDSLGNVLWHKQHGESGYFMSGATTSIDGGYALFGYAQSQLGDVTGLAHFVNYFVKTDANGNSGGCEHTRTKTTATPTITVSSYTLSLGSGGTALTQGEEHSFTVSVINKCLDDPAIAGFGWLPGCAGDTVFFYNSSTGAETYTWNFGDPASGADNFSTLFNPYHIFNSASDYTITLIATDGGDSDTIMRTITILPTTFINAGSNTTICAGDTITLNASGGSLYLPWQPGNIMNDSTITPLTTTTYTIIGVNGVCLDTSSVTVKVQAAPSISISGLNTICLGESTTLSVSGSNNYLWTTGETTASIIIEPLISTTYSVSTFSDLCLSSKSYTITVISTIIDAGVNQTITSGTEINLMALGGNSYNWSTTSSGIICSNCGTFRDRPTQTTTYYITETNSNCAVDSVTIYVLNCSNLFVPNAFSPNSDGVNDVLYVKNDCIQQLDFKIFDRWGNTVFQSANVNEGWDGTYQGEAMDPAVFVYYVNAVLLSGGTLNGKGNISLIR